jgi:hypothetical protein
MLFMVVERFKNRDAEAVYQRLRERGRMMPDGLRWVGSWIEANLDRCFQLMECDDARLFQDWILHWRDLMDFEITPVVPSEEMVAVIARHLSPRSPEPTPGAVVGTPGSGSGRE